MQRPGVGGATGKATSLQMLTWQRAEKLGSAAVPTAKEGDMKKQREWGKNSFLQTWCDLSLKNMSFPSSARVYLQGSLCLSVSRPIIPLQSNPSVVTYSSALIYF